jgi:transposase-like protein
MDSKQIKKLRRLVAQARQASGRGRVRYPKSVKEQVVAALGTGRSPSELSALIGIGVATLFKWSRVSGEDLDFRRVRVSTTDAPAEGSEIKLVLQNGLRVEGPANVATLRTLLEWLK